jgi:hypothetical protein
MSELKVKNAFEWHRPYSAIPGPITIPAGAPVEWNEKNKWFYVKPSFFNGIVRHDAIYYGCRVDNNNVEEAV